MWFFWPQYHNVGSFRFRQDQKNSVFSVLSHRLFTYYKVILDAQYVGFVGSLQDLNATGTGGSWCSTYQTSSSFSFFTLFAETQSSSQSPPSTGDREMGIVWLFFKLILKNFTNWTLAQIKINWFRGFFWCSQAVHSLTTSTLNITQLPFWNH